MRGLSFLTDGELFAVDVTLVQKIARNMTVTPVPTAPEAVIGIANMKGKVVTVLSLAALLRRERACGARKVHAVVFKPFTDGDDQMGLLIDKPGDLIDIGENEILPPPSTGAEENNYISGVAEIEGMLYRIINVDPIIHHFKNSGEKTADTKSMGGTGDDRKIQG